MTSGRRNTRPSRQLRRPSLRTIAKQLDPVVSTLAQRHIGLVPAYAIGLDDGTNSVDAPLESTTAGNESAETFWKYPPGDDDAVLPLQTNPSAINLHAPGFF